MLLLDPNTQVSSSQGASSVQNIVLVAGYDFDRTGVIFKILCESRFARYSQNPNRRFTLFDIRSGEVRVNEIDPARQVRTWTVVDTFTAVTSANYSGGGHTFDTNPAGVMSITDVYQYVRDLSTSSPGSLMELSFFSHGWMGGPILVNSYDQSTSATDRDPNDKDARLRKDFIAPTMDAAALAEFRSAFHNDGFTWVWGCNFAEMYHHVIAKVVVNSRYLTALGPSDTDDFNFEFNKTQAESYFALDPAFFPARDATTGIFPLTFTRSFKEIKKFFRRGMANTYSAVIAKASGRKCYGALLGTYATFERNVASSPLMVIPTKIPPYSDNFTSYIKFYKTYLSVNIDPDNRGYGEYGS